MLEDIARLPRVQARTLGELRLYAPEMLAHLDVMLSTHPKMESHPLPIGVVERRHVHRALLDELVEILASGDWACLLKWIAQTLTDKRKLGYSLEHWRIKLECWRQLIDSHLSPEAAREIHPLITWTLDHLEDLAENGEAA